MSKAIISLNNTLIASIIALSVSSLSCAQVNVRDSKPLGDSNAPEVAASAQATLYNELLQLRDEVTSLRGMVEEQAHTIRKLQQQRLNDYDEFDERISALGSPNTSAQNASVAASDEEQALYQGAIDKVINDEDYDGALEEFNQYLIEYPTGALAPDVYYWQGEIYSLQGKEADAEMAFTSLTNLYPNHPKTVEGELKLAEIYIRQGSPQDAEPLLERIINSDASSEIIEQAKALLK